MKQLFRALPIAMIALAFAGSSAGAQVVPVESQISASGQGDRRVKPTRAVVFFTVQGKGSTGAAAAAENARLVASTMRSLGSAGTNADDISNGGYNVAPDYEFNQGNRKQNGFVASNSIRVEVAKVADLGKIIDAGLAGGASQVGSARYSGEKMEDARRDALKSAVEAATQDAQAMAEAAGGRLGRLLSLSSSNTGGPAFFESQSAGAIGGLARSSVPTSMSPNDLTVTSFATGRWVFLPGR